MKIIGLLSFFDEPPELLKESISRVRALGVDSLIACDGPYDLYPAESQVSRFETIESVIECSTGMSFLLLSKKKWSGNEVEKRNYMLGLALDVADEGDWLLVFDADHMWEQADQPLQKLLESDQDARVAEVAIADCSLEETSPYWYEACLLYRAVSGMNYAGAHWRVVYPDGRVSTTLRTSQEARTVDVLDLSDHFHVRHTVYHQQPERREKQTLYYEGRDAGAGIER